jgi:hypothetical protein
LWLRKEAFVVGERDRFMQVLRQCEDLCHFKCFAGSHSTLQEAVPMTQ